MIEAAAILATVVLEGISLAVGPALAALVLLGGFALSRRFRFGADARAAERVGADALADAFERASDAAGFDLEDADDGRRWLSTTPPIATRIERLRDGGSAGEDNYEEPEHGS